jgi:hypothetical protein
MSVSNVLRLCSGWRHATPRVPSIWSASLLRRADLGTDEIAYHRQKFVFAGTPTVRVTLQLRGYQSVKRGANAFYFQLKVAGRHSLLC